MPRIYDFLSPSHSVHAVGLVRSARFPIVPRFIEIMALRVRNRLFMASRKLPRLRMPEPQPNATEALIALARAWWVTMIAVWLLLAALLLAPMWDRAIFVQAVRTALISNPETMQPIDDATADVPTGHENRPAHSPAP